MKKKKIKNPNNETVKDPLQKKQKQDDKIFCNKVGHLKKNRIKYHA